MNLATQGFDYDYSPARLTALEIAGVIARETAGSSAAVGVNGVVGPALVVEPLAAGVVSVETPVYLAMMACLRARRAASVSSTGGGVASSSSSSGSGSTGGTGFDGAEGPTSGLEIDGGGAGVDAWGSGEGWGDILHDRACEFQYVGESKGALTTLTRPPPSRCRPPAVAGSFSSRPLAVHPRGVRDGPSGRHPSALGPFYPVRPVASLLVHRASLHSAFLTFPHREVSEDGRLASRVYRASHAQTLDGAAWLLRVG